MLKFDVGIFVLSVRETTLPSPGSLLLSKTAYKHACGISDPVVGMVVFRFPLYFYQ